VAAWSSPLPPRSSRTVRECRLSPGSKMKRSSSFPQEWWARSSSYHSGAVRFTRGSAFQGTEGKSWCSLW